MNQSLNDTNTDIDLADGEPGEISPLSSEEAIALRESEGKIEAAFDTARQQYYIVGTELFRIRERKLYRGENATFAKYCEMRWNLSVRHARRLIEATSIRDNLKNGTRGSHFSDNDEVAEALLPSSERVARPLAGLEPEQQREAWDDAQKLAEADGVAEPTMAHTEQAVARVKNPRISQLAEEEGTGERLLHNLEVAAGESARQGTMFSDSELDAMTVLPDAPVSGSAPIAQMPNVKANAAPAPPTTKEEATATTGITVPIAPTEPVGWTHSKPFTYRAFDGTEKTAILAFTDYATDDGGVRHDVTVDGRFLKSLTTPLTSVLREMEAYIREEQARNGGQP